MKKTIGLLCVFICFIVHISALNPRPFLFNVGYGAGYKQMNFSNNSTDLTLPTINQFFSIDYQVNLKKKSLFLTMESRTYNARKKLNNLKATYNDQYLLIGCGKRFAKKWEFLASAGLSTSKLDVKKQVLDSPPDSLFRQYQFMTNEYEAKVTPCIKLGIRYSLFSGDDLFDVSLLCEGLCKLKSEKFFINQTQNKFLFNLGINFAIKL